MTEEKEKNKTVTEDEIKKMEEEVLQKQKDAEAKKKAEIDKLLKDTEEKGREAALKEYELAEKQRRMEEENKKLREELEKTNRDAEERLAALAKQTEERFQELESKKRGISKNESPFHNEPLVHDNSLDVDAINEASRRAFARAYLGKDDIPEYTKN